MDRLIKLTVTLIPMLHHTTTMTILGGGSIHDITDGDVICYSVIPDSLSTFTTTITTSSNLNLALTIQGYAICYDNPQYFWHWHY